LKNSIHNSRAEVGSNPYLDLIIAGLRDVASASAKYLKPELRRDILEIERRFACEGLSFLTRTLPKLGKAIDLALATNTPLQTSGFSTRKSKIPVFLGCLLREVFDELGRERSDASPAAVASLRQILMYCYKLELPIDENLSNEVISKFQETDRDLPGKQSWDAQTEFAVEEARKLVARVLSPVDPTGARLTLAMVLELSPRVRRRMKSQSSKGITVALRHGSPMKITSITIQLTFVTNSMRS
jgi:hypothetical protein